MAKTPKVSGNQMTRYLQKKGYYITRRKGSHITLRKEDLFTTVPVGTKTLGIGIQHTILSDANISKVEFVSDYERGLIK